MGKQGWRAAALCVAVGMAGLTACGGPANGPEKKAAPEVRSMNEALGLLRGYSSVHMIGELHEDDIVHFDLSADREGNCTGTFTYNGTFEQEILVKEGRQAWTRYTDGSITWLRDLLTKAGQTERLPLFDRTARSVKGKYIEVPRKKMAQEPVMELCDLDRGFSPFPSSVKQAERFPTDLDGKQVLRLVQLPRARDEVTVYVPAKGPVAPIRLEYTKLDNPVLMDLTEPGVPVEPVTPDASKVLPAGSDADLYPEFS